MASDGTGTQVDAWMINKCKVEMRGEELYNVVESHKEGDEEHCMRNKRNRKIREKSIIVFLFFCNNAVHVSDRIDSLRLSSLTHPLRIFIVGCALGQGLINRIWVRKIVQLQLAPSVGRTKASASATVEHGRTGSAPGGSSPG